MSIIASQDQTPLPPKPFSEALLLAHLIQALDEKGHGNRLMTWASGQNNRASPRKGIEDGTVVWNCWKPKSEERDEEKEKEKESKISLVGTPRRLPVLVGTWFSARSRDELPTIVMNIANYWDKNLQYSPDDYLLGFKISCHYGKDGTYEYSTRMALMSPPQFQDSASK